MQETFFISTSHPTKGVGKIAPAGRRNACGATSVPGASCARRAALAFFSVLPIAYLIIFIYWHPTNFFGLTQDDSIYFSSAKALAQGRGYILPSVPGAPAATKYPILYPLILSIVWRVDHSFPGNLTGATALSAAFGLAFVALSFIGLRKVGGLTDWEALVLAAFCAFHPMILYFSLNLLSDMPFAALAIAALILAERAIYPDGNARSAAYSGVLTGFAILTRMFGIAIALGVIAAAVARRAWRQVFIYSAFLLPFCAGTLWRLIHPLPSAVPVSAAGATTIGWKYTWAYYSSYLAAWEMGVPSKSVFWAMLQNNAASILAAPAKYFLDPLLAKETAAGRALVIVVSAAIFAGMVRQARRHGWKIVHYTLPFYAAIILFWNFPISSRFLLPFLPLFAAGLWFEGKHALELTWDTVANKKTVTDRVIAIAFAFLLAASTGALAWNYLTGMRMKIPEQSQERASLLEEKRGAYDWISQNAAPDATVIAYEDANVYLYTGRAALRPLVFTSANFYDPGSLKSTSTHITDVAAALGADYWLFSDDDYGIDWPEAFAWAHARMAVIEGRYEPVYRGKNGRVRLYRLGCSQRVNEKSCQ